MYRNLVNQRGSLTVTLPKTWVEKNNLKAKDEVKLDEKPEGLLISSNTGSTIKKLEIDAKKYSPGSLRSEIGYLYRLGYDEILVRNVIKEHTLKSFSNLVGVIVTQEGSYHKISFHSQDLPDIESIIDKIMITIAVSLDSGDLDLKFFRMQILELKDYAIRSISKNSLGAKGFQYAILLSDLSGFASSLVMDSLGKDKVIQDVISLKDAWLKRDKSKLILLTDSFYKKRKLHKEYDWAFKIAKSAMFLVEKY